MKIDTSVEIEKIITLYKKNKYTEAHRRCIKLLFKNKNNPAIIHLMAKIEFANGNFTESIKLLDQAIKIDPNNTGILLDLGNSYKKINSFSNALQNYQKIIELDPNNSAAYHNCGETLAKMEQYKLSIDLYSKSYHINNSNLLSLVGIARAYDSLHDYEMAISIYKKVIDINSNEANALLGLGDLYRKIYRYEDALDLAEKVVKIYPTNITSYSLRGNIRKDVGLLSEAVDDFDRIIELDPKSALAKTNKAMTLLMMGEYEKGWDLYDARWLNNEWRNKKYVSSKPDWNGEKNGTLLVWSEQGIGDEIMFSSMLTDISIRVNKLIVILDKRLIELFKRSFDSNITFVFSKAEAEKYNYDYQVAMGTLPKFVRNKESDFATSSTSYLLASTDKVNEMKTKIQKNINDLVIGVSWKSKNPKNGLKRGVELIDFLKKIQGPNKLFLNLQYGDTSDDIDYLHANSDLKIISIKEVDNFKDIDGLAALIMICDEVVSIDNSTIHLSGALGKKTTVLLQANPDWRWQLNRNDTPWYKSVKLIRDAII
jgi:tetratricopeptide (TPR) repeat protein